MARRRQGQTNFALGELSPLLAGRSDISLYRNGAAKLLNRQPLAQGGTTTRPGTRWVTSTLLSPGPIPVTASLRAFVFSETQRYVCILVAGAMWAFDAETAAFAGGVTGAPWTADTTLHVGWVQIGDTALVLHPDMVPQRIMRTGAASWSLGAMPVEVPPFGRFINASYTIAVSDVGAAGTTGTFYIDGGGVLTGDWLGRQIKYRGKRFQITAVLSAQDGELSWVEDSTDLDMTATADWSHEAWMPQFGYPACGEFIDGRLVLAASPAAPNGVWISRAGAPYSWETGTDDDMGITEPVGGAQVGTVKHLVAQERLLVLTDRALWLLKGADDSPITPTGITFRRVSVTGAGSARAAVYDGAAIYCDLVGRNLYEVLYDGLTERTQVNPVSIIGSHLVQRPRRLEPTAGDAERPEALLLMPLEDGDMTVFHSVRAEKIAAYFSWVTAGDWLDVCSVQGDVFVLVNRGANGICLEQLRWDAAPLDCARRITSPGRQRVWSGLGHLAGRTVSVVTRGHDLGDFVVSGDGVITMGEDRPEVFEIEAGLRFDQIIRPMPMDFDLQDGPARGMRKRLIRAYLQLLDSGPFKVQGRDVLLPFAGDDFDNPPPGKSGVVDVRLRGIDEDAQFDVVVDRPNRVTVLSLTREVSVGGG